MPLIHRRSERRARHEWLFAAATGIDRGELLLAVWLAVSYAKWGKC